MWLITRDVAEEIRTKIEDVLAGSGSVQDLIPHLQDIPTACLRLLATKVTPAHRQAFVYSISSTLNKPVPCDQISFIFIFTQGWGNRNL